MGIWKWKEKFWRHQCDSGHGNERCGRHLERGSLYKQLCRIRRCRRNYRMEPQNTVRTVQLYVCLRHSPESRNGTFLYPGGWYVLLGRWCKFQILQSVRHDEDNAESLEFPGGCISVPEDQMITILKNVQPGCQIIIDSASELKNYWHFLLGMQNRQWKDLFFKISPLSFFCA